MARRKKQTPSVDRVSEARAVYDARESERPVRKNHYLLQSKLDMAREILGARTETDALDMALDLVIYGESLAQGTLSLAGERYRDVLGIASEV